MLYATVTPEFAAEILPVWEPFNVFRPGTPPITPRDELAVYYELPEDILALKVNAINAHVSQVEAILEAVGPDLWWKQMSIEAFRPGRSEISLGFLGSGEFDPWSEPVELAARRSSTPTAPCSCARRRPRTRARSYDGWANKGLEHYGSLGIAADVLHSRPATTRSATRWSRDWTTRLGDLLLRRQPGAARPGGARRRSGPPPDRDPRRSAVRGMQRGVACLTEKTYDSDSQDFDSIWARHRVREGHAVRTALGHRRHVDPRRDGLHRGIGGTGQTFIGLDEDTAMVGDGRSWEVIGRAKVHVLRERNGRATPRATRFELPLPLGDGPAA